MKNVDQFAMLPIATGGQSFVLRISQSLNWEDAAIVAIAPAAAKPSKPPERIQKGRHFTSGK